MREILFRGKSIANGEWIAGNYTAPLPSNWGATIEDAMNFPNLIHVVNPDTVGQYTGLIDKNGKRIFEGDIIKARIEEVGASYQGYEWPAMRVDFINGAFCLSHTTKGTLCNFNGFAPSVTFEVIGNTYDNPGLVKEG